MMRCRLVRQWMAEFATDGLDPAREADFRAHLAACPRCAAEWRAVEEVEPLLALVPRDLPDAATQRLLHDRLAAVLDAEPMLPVPRRRAWAAAGAFACLLVGGLVGLRALSGHHPETATAPTPQVAALPAPTPPAPKPPAAAARAHHEAPATPPPPSSSVRVAAAPRGEPAAEPARPPRLARQPRAGLRHSPRRESLGVRVALAPSRPTPLVEERAAVIVGPAVSEPVTAAPPAPAAPPAAVRVRTYAGEASPVVRVALAAPDVRACSRSTFALRAVAEAPRPRAGLHVEPAVIESEIVPATDVAMRELDR